MLRSALCGSSGDRNRQRFLGSLWIVALIAIAVAGCNRGSAAIGEACGGNDDCDEALQCLNKRCVARCERAPECGDGFACDEQHLCRPATGRPSDRCASEVDCAPGLACQIGGTLDEQDELVSTCTAETAGRPTGAECAIDDDCRQGTCAMGMCIALCRNVRDCAVGTGCAEIPHPLIPNAIFQGCLPDRGTLSWTIPMSSPSGEVLLPVPGTARSAQLIMRVDDKTQRVGASRVLFSNTGGRVYRQPCDPTQPPCSPQLARDDYFQNELRHQPELGQSVLLIPSASPAEIGPGVYRVQVSSFRGLGAPGSAIPHVSATIQLAGERRAKDLPLHFFFLDLSEHSCVARSHNGALNAESAKTSEHFQSTYLGELRRVFAQASFPLKSPTYDNIVNRPELDGPDLTDVGDLLVLGKYSTGINVFFVRSLSPVGIQAYSPNPGPAGVGGTRQSGIVIGIDTLCYRDWTALARLTAHEIGRYLGLYHNVELQTGLRPRWRDQISDNDGGDPKSNLMYFSELGGTDLSLNQIELLQRNPALR